MTSIRQGIRRLTRDASPPFSCSVTVESVTRISEGFTRVSVAGDGLAAYSDVLPADAFKVFLPHDGSRDVDLPERGEDGIPYWPEGTRTPVLRAFTVRQFDAERLRLDFDVALHADGVAMRWVRAVTAGDIIGLSGMRREFHAGPGVERHLFAGDTTALPAITAIVESLDDGTPATVYLAGAHPSDRDLLPARNGVTVYWVSALAQAVREGARPHGRTRGVGPKGRGAGRTQAWIAAEASVVKELRRIVVDDLGVARDDLHAAAYWKAGLDSTQGDVVLLERYRDELDAGADVTDPDVRERVELELPRPR